MDRKATLMTEIIMILVSLFFIFPIAHLVMMTFKSPDIFYKPFALPNKLYLESYATAFRDMNFFSGLFNSIMITTVSICLTIIIASMAGYTITRMKHRFFQFCMFFFLAGMVLPAIGALIPLFKLTISMGLYGSRSLVVLLYTTSFIPFATFLYAAFTKSIPYILEESASIDGCNRWRAFWTIIFPLLLPATGTFVLTNVYGVWNDFFTPLIFLNQPDRMPLMPQIVQFMFNQQSVNFGPVFAVSVLASLPMVVLFLFTQKHMLKGLMIGSVKG
jgi:raffinose/stachyose/melibiose transport system permease protein